MQNVNFSLRSILFIYKTIITEYTHAKNRVKIKKMPTYKRSYERARALRPANGLPVIGPTGFGSGRLAIQSDVT